VIACVVMPFFVTSVERQLDPALSDALLVLSDSTRTVRHVSAISRQAAERDIYLGMALRHAQTLVPELSVLPLNPPYYRQSLDELIHTLSFFSNRIEVAYKGWGTGDPRIKLSIQVAASSLNPAVAFLDIGMLKPKSLYQLGQQLKTALELLCVPVQVGIASNRFTAWVAAQAAHEGDVAIVNPGEERSMLTCHPVSLLPLDEKVVRRLWWLGIRTLGDFAGLPSGAIRVQFGKPGQIAYQLAQGTDPTPIQPVARERELHRSFSFDGAVVDRQIITVALTKLISQVATVLEGSSQTARKLRLSLLLDDKGACEFEMRLRRRTNTAAQLHRAFQTLLDKASVSAPVSKIAVTLGDLVPLAAQQLELFPAMRLAESRQAVLEDLVSRYGERFFTASITDDHALLPELHVEFNAVEIA
jgi:nucleotidyltransferase/DNA polymerase involved in DNA repair